MLSSRDDMNFLLLGCRTLQSSGFEARRGWPASIQVGKKLLHASRGYGHCMESEKKCLSLFRQNKLDRMHRKECIWGKLPPSNPGGFCQPNLFGWSCAAVPGLCSLIYRRIISSIVPVPELIVKQPRSHNAPLRNWRLIPWSFLTDIPHIKVETIKDSLLFLYLSEIFRSFELESRDFHRICNKISVLTRSTNDFLGLSRKKETIIPPFNPNFKPSPLSWAILHLFNAWFSL